MLKMAVVMAIREFEKDVQELFRNAGIKTCGEVDIREFKTNLQGEHTDTWFAFGNEEYDSFMAFAFTSEDRAELLLRSISKFNDDRESESVVRGFILKVEKHV